MGIDRNIVEQDARFVLSLDLVTHSDAEYRQRLDSPMSELCLVLERGHQVDTNNMLDDDIVMEAVRILRHHTNTGDIAG